MSVFWRQHPVITVFLALGVLVDLVSWVVRVRRFRSNRGPSGIPLVGAVIYTLCWILSGIPRGRFFSPLVWLALMLFHVLTNYATPTLAPGDSEHEESSGAA